MKQEGKKLKVNLLLLSGFKATGDPLSNKQTSGIEASRRGTDGLQVSQTQSPGIYVFHVRIVLQNQHVSRWHHRQTVPLCRAMSTVLVGMKEAHEKAHTILHSQTLPMCPKGYTHQRRASVFSQSISHKQAAFLQHREEDEQGPLSQSRKWYVFLPWEGMTLESVYCVVHMTT